MSVAARRGGIGPREGGGGGVVAMRGVEDVDVAVVGGGPGGLACAKAITVAAPALSVAVFERARHFAPVCIWLCVSGVSVYRLPELITLRPHIIYPITSARSALPWDCWGTASMRWKRSTQS